MKQYKHILIPLDGSELAEAALVEACSLAQLNQAEIMLLQVISPVDHLVANDNYIQFIDELLTMYKDSARQYLESVSSREECKDLKVYLAIEIGSAAEIIIDYAHREPIDLIVMATHGRSGLQRWVYGSVADKVLCGANLPVLLVRAHSPREAA